MARATCSALSTTVDFTSTTPTPMPISGVRPGAVIRPSATVNWSAGNFVAGNSGTITNNATFNDTSTGVFGNSGVGGTTMTFTNAAGATFNDNNAAGYTINNPWGGSFIFTNNGTYVRNAAGTTNLASNVLLPVRADQLALNGNRVDPSQPFVLAAGTNAVVGLREGKAAVACRLFAADGVAGEQEGQPLVREQEREGVEEAAAAAVALRQLDGARAGEERVERIGKLAIREPATLQRTGDHRERAPTNRGGLRGAHKTIDRQEVEQRHQGLGSLGEVRDRLRLQRMQRAAFGEAVNAAIIHQRHGQVPAARFGAALAARVDRHRRAQPLEVAGQAAQRLGRVGDRCRDRLGRVHRRAAADRDDDRPRDPEGGERRAAVQDRGGPGVRLDLGVDADPDANLASALGVPAELRRSIHTISEERQLIEERTGAKAKEFGQIFRLNPDVVKAQQVLAKDLPKCAATSLVDLSGVSPASSRNCAAASWAPPRTSSCGSTAASRWRR